MLSKLFDVWDSVLDVLIRGGHWTQIETVLTLLQDADAVRPDLSETPQHSSPACSRDCSTRTAEGDRLHLNHALHAKTEGLLTLLLMMKQDSIPGLCSLLANLDAPSHQAVALEVLQTLARDHSDAIARLDRQTADL